jgi:hypothetical protein
VANSPQNREDNQLATGRYILGIGIVLLIFVLARTYAVRHSLSDVRLKGLMFVGDFATIILIGFICINVVNTVHEFGHYLVGKLLKHRWISTQIGYFYWWKSDNKLKFKLKGWEGTKSSTMLYPIGKEKPLQRMRGILLGGPLASLSLAALAIYLDSTINFKNGFRPPLPWLIWNENFALDAFTFFALCKVYTSLSSSKSDLRGIWRSYRDSEFVRLTIARRTLAAQVEAEEKPRNYDSESIQYYESLPFEERPLAVLSLYYQDRKEWDKANAMLGTLLEALLKKPAEQDKSNQALCYRGAFVAAMVGDIPLAKQRLFEGDKRGPATTALRKRACVAVAAAEGKNEEAIAEARRADSQLRQEEDMSQPSCQATAESIQWALEARGLAI